MRLNPFKKICVDDIKLKISSDDVTFSFDFDDKQEKEKNLAAGRIHRKLSPGYGAWKLEDNTLSVNYSFKNTAQNHAIIDAIIAFKEIAELFEEMTA